jgi:hypothetical protein
MYFHLKVVNSRDYVPARDCRVLLTAIKRRRPDGKTFEPVPMPVPVQFVWSPLGESPQNAVVTKQRVFDFGYVVENGTKFVPAFYTQLNNFEGFVLKDQVLRFYLEIDAANFASRSSQIFEVGWNGQWDEAPDKMRHNLVISEVKDA